MDTPLIALIQEDALLRKKWTEVSSITSMQSIHIKHCTTAEKSGDTRKGLSSLCFTKKLQSKNY